MACSRQNVAQVTHPHSSPFRTSTPCRTNCLALSGSSASQTRVKLTKKSSSFIYCTKQEQLDELLSNADSIPTDPFQGSKIIYLDCEGNSLGDIGGKLGLIQLGFGDKVYLVDVLALPSSTLALKELLESLSFTKVMWDGRQDYIELLQGHRIELKGVLDLQLVEVQNRRPPGRIGYVGLRGMSRAFSEISLSQQRASGINLNRRTQSLSHAASTKL